MEIGFTKHAHRQIKARNITDSEIRLTLNFPEKITKQSPIRFKAIGKTDNKYILIVIYEKSNNHLTIITAFRTSKLKKYL